MTGSGGEPASGQLTLITLLRTWRERALLTQEQVANRTGLAVRTIRRLETDDRCRPHGQSLRLLADALGLTDAEREMLVTVANANPRRPGPAGHSRSETGRGLSGAALLVSLPVGGPPAQLPSDAASFTGRTAELDELLALRPGKPGGSSTVLISAIDGMAGVGKTALAVHVGHRLAAHFSDGQLFIDLHGHTQNVAPVDPADALNRMLRTLGVPVENIPRHLDDRAALWRSIVAGRNLLIVLDNVSTEAQVSPLLPGTGTCLVLITSRRRLGVDGTHVLTLDTLSSADALALFIQSTGPQCLAGQPTAQLDDIVELCGRLPLAIRIAAARLRARPNWTAGDLVERLRDHRHRLAELHSGQRSVTAALDLSYRQLGGDHQRLYRLLGLHPGPDLDVHAAAALTGATARRCLQQLDELVDTHLLHEHVGGRYRFHDLVRAHAILTVTREEPQASRNDALTRLLDHYTNTGGAAVHLVHPSENHQTPRPVDVSQIITDAVQATRWLDVELVNLLAIAAHTADAWPAHTVRLSTMLDLHLRTRGLYSGAEALHGHALTAARQSGDRHSEMTALLRLDRIHRLYGRYTIAADCLHQSLTIAQDIGDPAGELNALRGLGHVHRLQGRHAAAADCFTQSMVIAQNTGNRRGELEALWSLGQANLLRGHHEPAVTHFGRALTLARDLGHRSTELTALWGLGHVFYLQGRYQHSKNRLTQALTLARDTGDRAVELYALVSLGSLHRAQHQHDQATDCYQQALTLARAIDDPNGQFEALHGLGHTLRARGSHDPAIEHHQAALDLARDLDQPNDQARAHDGLAQTYHAVGRHQQARWHWQQTLTILADLDLTETEDINAEQIRANLAETDPHRANS